MAANENSNQSIKPMLLIKSDGSVNNNVSPDNNKIAGTATRIPAILKRLSFSLNAITAIIIVSSLIKKSSKFFKLPYKS